jgi:hypothetical protein
LESASKADLGIFRLHSHLRDLGEAGVAATVVAAVIADIS